MNPLSYALKLLKRRLYSKSEMVATLNRKGISEGEIIYTIEELERVGLINDRQYIKSYIRTKDRLKPTGDNRLLQELKLKGVDLVVVKQALADRKLDEEEPIDEIELAKKAMQGRERMYAHLPPEVRKRRMYGFLARRGFSSNVIWHILNT